MRSALMRCLKDEDGGEVLEYSLVLGLVVIGALGFMSHLGIRVADRWREIAQSLL